MNCTRQCYPLLPRLVIAALDVFEFLHQTNRSVARLCQGKLLAKADSRATVEGKILLLAINTT